MSETLHATCVAIGGRGILLAGGSGCGKSDLALRLIDRGARLVSDDHTLLRAEGGRLLAAAPATIAGKLEMRGVGIVELAALESAPVCLLAELERVPDRLPEPATVSLAGLDVPAIALAALEASAPIKLEQALIRFGLSLP
jgi:serine kinase of HPr protein (carbohydrate metabolism regulator)